MINKESQLIDDVFDKIIKIYQKSPSLEGVILLLKNIEDVNLLKDEEGNNLLHLAILNERLNKVIYNNVKTYSHRNYNTSSNKKNEGVVKEANILVAILIECGLDVNAKNNNGMTPLMLAGKLNNRPKTILKLLEAGANILEKNNDGKIVLKLENKDHNPHLLTLAKFIGIIGPRLYKTEFNEKCSRKKCREELEGIIKYYEPFKEFGGRGFLIQASPLMSKLVKMPIEKVIYIARVAKELHINGDKNAVNNAYNAIVIKATIQKLNLVNKDGVILKVFPNELVTHILNFVNNTSASPNIVRTIREQLDGSQNNTNERKF